MKENSQSWIIHLPVDVKFKIGLHYSYYFKKWVIPRSAVFPQPEKVVKGNTWSGDRDLILSRSKGFTNHSWRSLQVVDVHFSFHA
ncbi:hypothetical protein TNCT_196811, partial [Trichonephila clavata]